MSAPDALLLLLTGACFVALVVAARLPVSLSLVSTSVVLAFAAGRGFPLSQLVEGMFSYLDVVLVLFMAMVFMKVIEANGLMGELTRGIIATLGRSPVLLLPVLLFLFPMFGSLRRRFTKVTVTGDKLRYETGILSRTCRTIQLSKVQDVSVVQTLWQRLVGIGSRYLQHRTVEDYRPQDQVPVNDGCSLGLCRIHR